MATNTIKGLAKGIIKELIKADMTMHEQQAEAWTWMSRNRPTGDDIPHDIMKGIASNRYLSINEVNFKFHLKPIPVKTFWERWRLAYKLLYDKNYHSALQPYVFDLCGSTEKEAQTFTINIKRLENGKIKASYAPDDPDTAEMMKP